MSLSVTAFDVESRAAHLMSERGNRFDSFAEQKTADILANAGLLEVLAEKKTLTNASLAFDVFEEQREQDIRMWIVRFGRISPFRERSQRRDIR